VRFRSVDFEQDENASLARKYDVTGSSLIIATGDRHDDLTVKAFQYALGDPGKLQALLLKTVDASLK
jgi:hypothetical protein